jgi:hypothetical protein
MLLDSIFELTKLVATGAVGGLAVAWSNWGVEKRRSKLAYRRELVTEWRKMVQRVAHIYETQRAPQDDSFTELLERQQEYFSLKPHLSSGTLEALKTEKNKKVVDVVIGGRKTRVNPADHFVELLVNDIARIEREWDLV